MSRAPVWALLISDQFRSTQISEVLSRGGESDGEVSSGSREIAAAAASKAQSGVAPPGQSQSGAAVAGVLERCAVSRPSPA